MNPSRQKNLIRLILAALFLALALVLPFLTGQIQQFGNMLCPMHFPVLLCGFFCGPWLGLAVGFIAPLWRSLQFGMPQLFPVAVAMAFELAAYGFVAGLLYKLLPKKKIYVYVSLISAMLVGRLIWGLVRVIFYGVWESAFGWSAFFAGAFTNAIPGIVLQLIIIPILVITLTRLFPQLREDQKDHIEK